MMMTYLMQFFMNLWQSFSKREEGQGMVEYALLIGLIAIAVIAVLLLLGPQIAALFTRIVTALQGI